MLAPSVTGRLTLTDHRLTLRLMKCRRLLPVAALLGGALLPQLALADCIRINESLRADVPYADAVFSGKVTDVADLSGALDRFVTFDVERAWKGPVTKRFSIHSLDRTLDRYEFDVGRKYLVF